MKDEYDFSGGVRGKYAGKTRQPEQPTREELERRAMIAERALYDLLDRIDPIARPVDVEFRWNCLLAEATRQIEAEEAKARERK